ncbi:YcxB family protein [Paraflavitalea soli]|uniref:YcxB family protein n=1 Tax=Paraflavitalea soli TaxID=2315862 RepID=A0A3B7MJZ0_9BACT|nr:YcxB family protein [Paraflavitalea soli]AXY74498.1 YcxB family protein [Paraflavitalea soli]
MLVLKYHLTEEEYFDYNYFTAWASPEKKGYRIRYYLRVFLLYTGVAVLFIISRHSKQLLWDFIIFGIIAITYFLLVPWLIRRSIGRRVKDILRQPENQHVLGEAEVILMDTGIIDKDEAAESKYSWDAIVRKAETPSCYFLYTNSYHAIVIPKRAIRNPADKQELERMLSQHLSLTSEFSKEED